MYITDNGEYENASMVLITHEDKDYSNSTFKLVCNKSRKKMDNGSYSKWGDLNFRFEIMNKDMTYGSNGNYRCVNMTRSDFLSWMLSLQDALRNPDVYKNQVVVKRRFKKNDFIIKFAVSEKLNCNAILMCILTKQSVFSKIGITGLLFNQFMLQLGKMAVDILNFELSFDNSILLYKNNQNSEYQSSQMEIQTKQNAEIIKLLSFGTMNTSVEKENNVIPQYIEKENEEKTIELDETSFENEVGNIGDDIEPDIEKEEIKNDNEILEMNNHIFEEEDIENIELEKIFELRQEDIDNPKEITKNETFDETTLMKVSKLNEHGIEVFSKVFKEAQKGKIIQEKGLDIYFNDILGENNFYLPSCKESDVISLSYLSQFQFSNILVQYGIDKEMTKYIDIPLVYKIEDYDYSYDMKRNIFDLIAIYTYMVRYSKSFKIRLTDSLENKEIFTRCFRLIFEPVYMTYLNSTDFDKNLEDVVFQHYKNLDKIDFFKDWNDKFLELDLALPSDEDIKLCIEELKEYVQHIKGMTAKMIHDKYYEKETIKLPYKNKFKQEHINEIVNMECFLSGEKNITEKVINSGYKAFDISPNKEMIEYFKKIYIPSNKENEAVLDKLIVDTKIDKNSSLYRYVDKYLEKDWKHKKELLAFIKEIDEDNLSLSKLPDYMNIHSIPDDILIALNIWKPKDDIRIKQFSYLIEQVKNSWQTKTDIISDYMLSKENAGTVEKLESSTDWGAFV